MCFLSSRRILYFELPLKSGFLACFLLYPRGFIHIVDIRFLLWDTDERLVLRGVGCVCEEDLTGSGDTRKLEVSSP